MTAEHTLIEARGHFIVLLVGRIGLDRDFRACQFLDALRELLGLGLRVAGVLFAQPTPQQPANRNPDQPVRHDSAFGKINGVQTCAHPRAASAACASGFREDRSRPAWRNSSATIKAQIGPRQRMTTQEGATQVTAPNLAAAV